MIADAVASTGAAHQSYVSLLKLYNESYEHTNHIHVHFVDTEAIGEFARICRAL